MNSEARLSKTISRRSQRRIGQAVGTAGIMLVAFSASPIAGQTKEPFARPSPAANVPSPAIYQSAAANSTPPPMGATMRQKTWNTLSNTDLSLLGGQAVAMNPRAWFHGETEDFIIHYRNFSDALQVAREIEFDLWYVARTLGATREQYSRKSHVYVFQDDKEWQAFVAEAHERPWSHSFALRDELFLNVHGTGSGFESHTLAHETTHAVVARIYGDRRWPLWLNEGFADYMADACASVRRGLPPTANPPNRRSATMSLTDLIAISRYPDDPLSISQLYETGAKFVRYLFTKYRPDLFVRFVDRLIDRNPAQTALVDVYGDEFRDLAAFDKRFASSR
ncbi:MAG: hypothetical protein ACJ8M1_10180 [Chthoniobacterales bacterium]